MTPGGEILTAGIGPLEGDKSGLWVSRTAVDKMKTPGRLADPAKLVECERIPGSGTGPAISGSHVNRIMDALSLSGVREAPVSPGGQGLLLGEISRAVASCMIRHKSTWIRVKVGSLPEPGPGSVSHELDIRTLDTPQGTWIRIHHLGEVARTEIFLAAGNRVDLYCPEFQAGLTPPDSSGFCRPEAEHGHESESFYEDICPEIVMDWPGLPRSVWKFFCEGLIE